MPCIQIILLSVTSWVTLSTSPHLALYCILNNVNNNTWHLELLQWLVEAVWLKHCECLQTIVMPYRSCKAGSEERWWWVDEDDNNGCSDGSNFLWLVLSPVCSLYCYQHYLSKVRIWFLYCPAWNPLVAPISYEINSKLFSKIYRFLQKETLNYFSTSVFCHLSSLRLR